MRIFLRPMVRDGRGYEQGDGGDEVKEVGEGRERGRCGGGDGRGGAQER